MTRTQIKPTALDLYDAWCHEYEAALRGEAERDAMFAAEVSGDDRPLWRILSGALVVLAAFGVALTAVIQIGRGLGKW